MLKLAVKIQTAPWPLILIIIATYFVLFDCNWNPWEDLDGRDL